MKNIIIIENVRSAYNVWNIIRTADALWWDVIISWYSPSPFKDPKVTKSSLWAENHINIQEFRETKAALHHAQKTWYTLIAAEITTSSLSLDKFSKNWGWSSSNFAVIVGNEVEWVLPETLDVVDHIVHIPMKGQKASLNVWQAAAIFMRELSHSHVDGNPVEKNLK